MMWQIRILLGAVLLASATDAFFFNWFKKSQPKPSYSAPSYQQPQQYSYYSPPAYKVPVWQAMPSGYSAYPVQQQEQQYQQQSSYNSGSDYSYQAPAPSYNAPSYNAPSYSAPSPSYSAPAQQPSYSAPAQQPSYSAPAQQPSYSAPAQPPSYSSQDTGVSYGAPAPVAAPPAASPSYSYDTATYQSNPPTDAGSSYTGGSTLVSVPVYFPKHESSAGDLTGGVAVNSAPTYNNGVSGFYDGAPSETFLTIVPAPKS